MAQGLLEKLANRDAGALNFEKVLGSVRIPFCVTDPHEPGNPIVFVNPAFTALTGYTSDEVVGRNCNVLQGPGTTDESIEAMREQMRGRRLTAIDVVNYRKDGSEFVNSVLIAPITGDAGETLFFFGSQHDVTAERAAEAERRELTDREIAHRVRNLVTVMTSLIGHTSREFGDREAFVEGIIGRMQALAAAHLANLGAKREASVDAVTLTRTIAEHYAPRPEQLRIEGPALTAAPEAASALALAIHELATNSLKHGALSKVSGVVEVRWEAAEAGGGLRMTWTESGGPEVEKSDRASGSAIIARLLERVGGRIDYDWRSEGVVIELTVPGSAG